MPTSISLTREDIASFRATYADDSRYGIRGVRFARDPADPSRILAITTNGFALRCAPCDVTADDGAALPDLIVAFPRPGALKAGESVLLDIAAPIVNGLSSEDSIVVGDKGTPIKVQRLIEEFPAWRQVVPDLAAPAEPHRPTFGINPALLQALAGEKIGIRLELGADPLAPLRWWAGEVAGVVMPMRLDDVDSKRWPGGGDDGDDRIRQLESRLGDLQSKHDDVTRLAREEEAHLRRQRDTVTAERDQLRAEVAQLRAELATLQTGAESTAAEVLPVPMIGDPLDAPEPAGLGRRAEVPAPVKVARPAAPVIPLAPVAEVPLRAELWTAAGYDPAIPATRAHLFAAVRDAIDAGDVVGLAHLVPALPADSPKAIRLAERARGALNRQPAAAK